MVLPKVDSALGMSTGINVIDRGILRYPAMVDVYFQGIDMNYYYKFKTSMISQFSVDYTPNGLAINKGGRPSVMRIEMTLQEAYIHTKEDYELNDLKTEATAEKTNENKQNQNQFDGFISSFYPVDSGQVSLKDSLNPNETVVDTADATSRVKPATNAGLADEVMINGVSYTINQLVARGVDRATIVANPSVYVPSSIVQA
jgi:hypothetical protein